MPRDRDGEFEPQLVKKNQTTLTGDIEEKIISMYAKGMTTSDIEAHIRDIYGLECSDTTISRITDKILPVVREWQSRPLDEIYAVVFMDAIHFHVCLLYTSDAADDLLCGVFGCRRHLHKNTLTNIVIYI